MSGLGLLNENPLFVNETNANYSLTQNSPCIDSGDPNSPLDPDGSIADMGAYYHHHTQDFQLHQDLAIMR